MNDKLSKYLVSTQFLDFDHPVVQKFTEQYSNQGADSRDNAVSLYYAVRDKIIYDPYDVQPEKYNLQASTVVQKGSGYCVAKAVLLAAAARYLKIPARLGFADVTNHLSTNKLRKIMGSDLFIYHGYTELLLDGNWVKATPAFNLSLCQRFHVKPLDFDGLSDSLFHQYDTKGQKHMEYMKDHGHFDDLPFEKIFKAYNQQYPGMFDRFKALTSSNFSKEAEEEN